MFEDGLFGSLWSVDAETIDGGGDFVRSDGFDVRGVEGSIEPCDVGVFQPAMRQHDAILLSCDKLRGMRATRVETR